MTGAPVRVLYMSGYTEDAIVQHGVLEPGLAFMQKPFFGEALVRRWISWRVNYASANAHCVPLPEACFHLRTAISR